MMAPDLLPIQPTRLVRVAAIGLASWDRLIAVDRYPRSGSYAVVREEIESPGGTTANSAVALARLGARVLLRAHVGDDEAGRTIRESLISEGIAVDSVTVVENQPTDAATVIVSRDPPDRTILWHQGARLIRGDRIDIPGIFGQDVVLVDVDDTPLRRFLVDLPVHTLPAARLLGSLTYLDNPGVPDAFDLLMRHDVVVGNTRELMTITDTGCLDAAMSAVRARMRGEVLRAAVISQGADGATAFTVDEAWQCSAFDVPVIDTTGAGDTFAGAVAFGMACRWAWPVVLRFANATAALSTTALGSQTALPCWGEVISLMTAQPRP
jgi:sugar/nucleoside kinase (ribokinase family)